MKQLLSLGDLYISDFIKDGEQPRGGKHELCLVLDETIQAPRLQNPPSPDLMFGKYWYRSGINQTMKSELKEIVDSVSKIKHLKENDIWIDIASNDGTLLSYLPTNIIRVGIDPADDTYKVEAEKHSNLIIQDYFTAQAYKSSRFGEHKAKVITCIAMFYDIIDPKKFLLDVASVLDDGGVFVLQMSYTPLMLNQLAFDNICHEHTWYYSLFNIKKLLEDAGFCVFDCELNDVNGGSFRVYSTINPKAIKSVGTQQYRDVASYRVESTLEYEKTQKLNDEATWTAFFNKIENLKSEVYNFIAEKKRENKKVWAYGASTKGNTLLQYFGLDNTLIDGIAERSSYKWGLKTVGTNITIYSEDQMRKENPDYLLVLPWHFINEFINRESDFLRNGGTFIVPCPKFELINYKNQ